MHPKNRKLLAGRAGWKKTLLIFFALLIAPLVPAQSPKKLKADDEAYREYKITLSRQLGVTCTTCHNTSNFNSGEKVNFQIAKQHMKIVQLLIDNGFDGEKGRPKADCYMCHRGQLKPDYKEPFDPMTMSKSKTGTKKSKGAPTEDTD